jgi:hypothetical protein
MITTPYPFPIHVFQDVFKVTSIPAIEGTHYKHTVVTESAYPTGNNTRVVQTYSVTLYDAAGRLDAYNHRFGSFDRNV